MSATGSRQARRPPNPRLAANLSEGQGDVGSTTATGRRRFFTLAAAYLRELEAQPVSRSVTDSDLALILDATAKFVRRFVVLSADQAAVLALWVFHTHALASTDTTPYVGITTAEKRSGKTLLLEVLGLLVREPLPTANISDAALFRAIAKLEPTLLFDEVDAIFGPKARDREDLRGHAERRLPARRRRLADGRHEQHHARVVPRLLPEGVRRDRDAARHDRATGRSGSGWSGAPATSRSSGSAAATSSSRPSRSAQAIASTGRATTSTTSPTPARSCPTSSTTARRTAGSRCSRSPTSPAATGRRAPAQAAIALSSGEAPRRRLARRPPARRHSRRLRDERGEALQDLRPDRPSSPRSRSRPGATGTASRSRRRRSRSSYSPTGSRRCPCGWRARPCGLQGGAVRQRLPPRTR